MTAVYGVLWFGQFAAVAGLTVVVPLMPFYLAGLGVAAGDVPLWTGVALAAPAVTQLVSAPLWGRVGDRCGHKAMVVRAHVGLGAAVGLMALATTPAAFLACRLFQGAFGGVLGATASYATSLAADERRGRTLGSLTSATAAGALVGPLLGSVLAGVAGYPTLFACVAALLAASSTLAVVVLPATRRTRRPDPARLRGVIGQLVRTPDSAALLLAGMAGQAAIFALVVVFAPQVQRITASLAVATIWVGVLQAVTWAGSLAGGPWWGRRNDHADPRGGFTLAAVLCGVAVTLQAVPVSPGLIVPLRLVQGFCFAAFTQSVLHTVTRVARPQDRGTAIGVGTGVLDLGQVAGPLLGALAAATLPLPAVFVVIGALLGLCAVTAARGWRCRGTVPHPRELTEVPSWTR